MEVQIFPIRLLCFAFHKLVLLLWIFVKCQNSVVLFSSGVRATRVRMLRKEIALVRRKLNQEKRQLSESSGKRQFIVTA